MNEINLLIAKPNFFILTGGPGAGKTTVLNELSRLGYVTIPEVARIIIKNQEQINGDALHQKNRNSFRDLVLENSIEDFYNNISFDRPVFFDRGIPDLEGYTQGFCSQINPKLKLVIDNCRYNNTVFIFPPWEAIYTHDEERHQEFQEAIMTYEVIKKAYQMCGYALLEMPKASISERVTFILQHMQSK